MNKTLISTMMICGAGFALADKIRYVSQPEGVTEESYHAFYEDMVHGKLGKQLGELDDEAIKVIKVLLQHDTLTAEQKSKYASYFIEIMKRVPLPIMSKLAGIPQPRELHISDERVISIIPEFGGYGDKYTITGLEDLSSDDKNGYDKFAVKQANAQKKQFKDSYDETLKIINDLQSVEFDIIETPLDSYGIEVGVSYDTVCDELFSEPVILSEEHLLTFQLDGDDYCFMSVMSSVESSDDAYE